MYKAINLDLLGETLLVKTLSSAYYIITESPIIRWTEQKKEAQEALYLIQNSGIHKIVKMFGLSIDADKLQNLFFYYIKIA